MGTARKLLVLGGGPVGLMATICARRNGMEAEVRSSVWPSQGDAATLESVPSQTMALLVETGVFPRSVGVDKVFTEQMRQWNRIGPSRKMTTGRVHLSRPELDIALLELAESLGVVLTTERVDRNTALEHAEDGETVFDASGRSSVTASAVSKPRRPIVGRQWLFETNEATVATFGIGAGKGGYFYRMGNAHRICLGVVGNGALMRSAWPEVRAEVAETAAWLVHDLPAEFAEIGRSGATTMQWSNGRREPLQIGDAVMAQDALSSQGLAVGLVDAVQSVLAHLGRPATALPADRSRTISSGRSLVAEIVAMSSFAGDPLWVEYLEFLDGDEWKIGNPTRTGMSTVYPG
ncbi:hypothetical protein [Mesorhizobium sp. M0619]|uniref:hypothetical protein n=1 Tax=unclassified Mesorhizobium TaxID=325217 RepID=UPI0033353599